MAHYRSQPQEPKATLRGQKRYRCTQKGCSKTYATLSSRNKHVRAKHEERDKEVYLKHPKPFKQWEARHRRELMQTGPAVRLIDRNPRSKKPVGRPRKPIRPGRRRGRHSKLPTEELLHEKLIKPLLRARDERLMLRQMKKK